LKFSTWLLNILGEFFKIILLCSLFLPVRRNAMFNPGSDVNLTCSSKMWNETLFVIWKLDLTYKKCDISFSNDGRNGDSCNDGKSLRNTSSAQSYLHIPNFSTRDVGLYTCESVFKGGNENYIISVAITGKMLFLINTFLEHVLPSTIL
uniref:Ig-like domain-containing protein n=1 Tax=Stegastes partitus TaxID=144197 RepID=A0A3B5AZM7_9TELE